MTNQLDKSFNGDVVPTSLKFSATSRIDASELLSRMAAEVEGLRFLLTDVETAMCEAFEFNKLIITGEIATSLQQLDLAIQISGCLIDILTTGAEDVTRDGHAIVKALERLPLKDLARRFGSELYSEG